MMQLDTYKNQRWQNHTYINQSSSCKASTSVHAQAPQWTPQLLESKSSIVPETIGVCAACRTWLSRSCNACISSFSVLFEGSKLSAEVPSNTLPTPKWPWWWFPQRGPAEPWRNGSVTGCCSVPSAIHHGTFCSLWHSSQLPLLSLHPSLSPSSPSISPSLRENGDIFFRRKLEVNKLALSSAIALYTPSLLSLLFLLHLLFLAVFSFLWSETAAPAPKRTGRKAIREDQGR